MSQEAAAVWVDVAELRPWANNPRDNRKAIDEVAKSIRRFGWGSPIVANKRDGEIIAGHTRFAAAQKLKLDKVPVRWLDLDPADAHALALADNKVGEIATWDDEKLREVLQELQQFDESLIADTGFDVDELDELISGKPSEDENSYTRKINIPIYEPTGPKPAVQDLIDSSKTDELLAQIAQADLPEDVRTFLVHSAQRHTRFNFQKIAEFYAHSDPHVQALFEQSALVIIDVKDAIARGFAEFTGTVFDLVDVEGVEDAP